MLQKFLLWLKAFFSPKASAPSPLSQSPVVPSPSPAPAPAPKPDPKWPLYSEVVGKGSALSALVILIQKRLAELGYAIDVDGDFGIETEAAVKAFQATNLVGTTGVVGKETWGVLFSDNAKRFSPHGGSGHAKRPAVDYNHISECPNYASRNGMTIDTIVLHNTEGSLQSAISRFEDVNEQVSAHFIIDRDGECVQMVDEHQTAWHSGDRTVNQRSIGIENVAGGGMGYGLQGEQEATLVAWCKYLMSNYNVPLARVFPHRHIVATSCPGSIWSTDAEFEAWKQKHLT